MCPSLQQIAAKSFAVNVWEGYLDNPNSIHYNPELMADLLSLTYARDDPYVETLRARGQVKQTEDKCQNLTPRARRKKVAGESECSSRKLARPTEVQRQPPVLSVLREFGLPQGAAQLRQALVAAGLQPVAKQEHEDDRVFVKEQQEDVKSEEKGEGSGQKHDARTKLDLPLGWTRARKNDRTCYLGPENKVAWTTKQLRRFTS